MNDSTDSIWLSRSKICETLSISERTLDRRVKKGLINKTAIDGNVRYRQTQQTTIDDDNLHKIDQLKAENEGLKKEVEELKADKKYLQEQLKSALDTIKQQNQMLIPEKTKSFWQPLLKIVKKY